jgi:hypothetical protein
MNKNKHIALFLLCSCLFGYLLYSGTLKLPSQAAKPVETRKALEKERYTPDNIPALDAAANKRLRPFTRAEKSAILERMGLPPLRPEATTIIENNQEAAAIQGKPSSSKKEGIWSRLFGKREPIVKGSDTLSRILKGLDTLSRAYLEFDAHKRLVYQEIIVVGLVLAYLLSWHPELRKLRGIQMVCIPWAMACIYAKFPENRGVIVAEDINEFLFYLTPLTFLAMAIAPSLTYYCGLLISNIISPLNWTANDEEVVLKPVRDLINADQPAKALRKINQILRNRKMTYEAGFLRAKLLYHHGEKQEAKKALLNLLRIAKSKQQQVGVIEVLRGMGAA